MPGLPATPCRSPGCGDLSRDGSGRCVSHPREVWSKAGLQPHRIRGRKLQALRKQLFDTTPLCVECQRRGDVVVATQRDHVVSLGQGGKDTQNNTQALCAACHSIKTQVESARGAHAKHQIDFAVSNFPEWLEPASCHLTVVFGPPGCGKSTYVSSKVQPNDIVIDYDEIMAQLSGMPIYQAPQTWLLLTTKARNERLSALHRCAPTTRAWFMTGGAGSEQQQWWIDKLRPAEIVRMDADADTCIARIMADPRRDKVRQRHVEAVYRWFESGAGQLCGSRG